MAYEGEIALAVSWVAGGGLLVIAGPGRRLVRVAWRWLRRTPSPAAARRRRAVVWRAPRTQAGQQADRTAPKPFTGKAWIIDGDTLDVGRARVRLFGMDAPEMSQAGGGKAKSHLIQLAGRRQVSVQPVDVDCYGRIVARVKCGGVDLSERMVADGFARAMTNWHLDYAATEFRARRERRGLWAEDPANGIGDPAAHRRAESVVRGR